MTVKRVNGKFFQQNAHKGELRVNKTLVSLFVSAAIIIAPLPAMSADTGPLAPGSAAGVKQAQSDDNVPLYWLLGAGAVIALGVLALSNNNDNGSSPSTPSTSTTTTTATTTTTTTTP
ncbi:MAG TPA: hypothetical protein VHT51_10480 [Micropepsaceae bacterium]|nr:hypothetical protein [Micropepsaceae bacterium]